MFKRFRILKSTRDDDDDDDDKDEKQKTLEFNKSDISFESKVPVKIDDVNLIQ